MRRIIYALLISFFSVFMVNESHAQEADLLRHVVSFKFSDDATKSQIKSLIKDFAGLKDKIPQIQSFEWGTNNSPEGLNKDMTHCFILTFKNETDRDIYLPHPDHKAFGAKHGKILADVFVIDYYAKGDM